ncbi:MAG: hypothetical protein CO137_03300 [Candidatus Magasanikbacteria bacterium CG_4_9_14_3_um_filter_32_9]|uniref:Uncharacterized protein n=1 Tax=Candidatus Magasanikbacteria bacterium CG_4_9_14_3_um_filter_32_9 TaxID=1974644 RepID=A0A2M7Z678_9BACT|nr:MAG: hypothetical protein CO137_03300 [Candidatus Magasanikbacteria bacterium CG_4_9_14_3_um_filter_32_9]
MTKHNLGYVIIKKICKLLHKKEFVEGSLTYDIAQKCGYKNLEELVSEIRRIAIDEHDTSIDLKENEFDVFKVDPLIYYEVYPTEKIDKSKPGRRK